MENKNKSLFCIILSQLIIVIDGTVIYTALPSIASDLHFSPSALSWVPNAYMLTFGGLMLLGSRAGDLLGHKKIFLTANTFFVVASCIAGLSGTSVVLIISRALQGSAAAFAAPSAFSFLMILFNKEVERQKAIRLYTAVSGAGSAIGLVLGGVLTSYLSWRFVFFINLPVGLLLITGGLRYLPQTDRENKKPDISGALTCTSGMSLIVYGLTQHNSDYAITSAITGIVIMLVFIAIEKKSLNPIVPLSIFSNRIRSKSYLGKFLLVGGMLGSFFFLTQYTQNDLGFSSFETSLIFLPLSLTQFIMVMVCVPRLMPKTGPRALLLCGLFIALSGMIWLYFMNKHNQKLIDFILPAILLGAGSGAALVPLAIFGVHDIQKNQTGPASGILNAIHYLGGAFGTAVIISLLNSYFIQNYLHYAATEGGFVKFASLCSAIMFSIVIFLFAFD